MSIRRDTPLMNETHSPTIRSCRRCAGLGFEIVHIGPHVLHGGGSGHATVLYGGLPIGTVDRDGFGEWEFTPGDPGAHVEVVQPTVERVEPVEPAPTLFLANVHGVCSRPHPAGSGLAGRLVRHRVPELRRCRVRTGGARARRGVRPHVHGRLTAAPDRHRIGSLGAGTVAERTNAPALKAGGPQGPGVRIPPVPLLVDSSFRGLPIASAGQPDVRRGVIQGVSALRPSQWSLLDAICRAQTANARRLHPDLWMERPDRSSGTPASPSRFESSRSQT